MLENLSLNMLDIGVLCVMLVGCLIGLVLGIVRAGLFVISWLGAGLATIYGLPIVRVFARQQIAQEFYADLVAGVSIFLVTLVILFLLSSLIGGWVRGSRLNVLDRSLGMITGLATAVLLLAIGVLVMDNIINKNMTPELIQTSRSLPLIRQWAYFINDQLPESIKSFGPEDVKNAVDQTKEALEKSIFDTLTGTNTKK